MYVSLILQICQFIQQALQLHLQILIDFVCLWEKVLYSPVGTCVLYINGKLKDTTVAACHIFSKKCKCKSGCQRRKKVNTNFIIIDQSDWAKSHFDIMKPSTEKVLIAIVSCRIFRLLDSPGMKVHLWEFLLSQI